MTVPISLLARQENDNQRVLASPAIHTTGKPAASWAAAAFRTAAGVAAVERLERTAGLALAVRWLREAHVTEHLGVEKPTQKLRSFFSRWSIQFSAEYYEAKERQASGIPSLDSGKLRTLR